jgi:hypothetical protein
LRNAVPVLLQVLLVVLLLVSTMIIDNVTSPWKERVKIALMLLLLGLLWYAAAAILRLRRASGAVLLDLPHSWPAIRVLQVLVAAGGIALGVYYFMSLPEGLEAVLARVLAGLVCLTISLLLLAAALGRLQFTERGVFGPSGYIAWQDIAAYRWEGGTGHKLRLIPSRYLPFFGSVPWVVPAEQKGAVEEVLASRVAASKSADR